MIPHPQMLWPPKVQMSSNRRAAAEPFQGMSVLSGQFPRPTKTGDQLAHQMSAHACPQIRIPVVELPDIDARNDLKVVPSGAQVIALMPSPGDTDWPQTAPSRKPPPPAH